MANIKILSLNCQGLGAYRKRKDVFQYLRQKQYSVYFLQDTHFTTDITRQIRAEWGYECVLSCYNSKSRGVGIFFNNNFDFKIQKTIVDSNGNYILLLIKTMDTEILLVNIYGPNKDEPAFFENIKNKIEEFDTQNIIIGGDWNLVLNPQKDYYNYKNLNNPNARDIVLDIMSDLQLSDIWRDLNTEVLRYTWRRPTPFQQSRLDFFLISENLLDSTKDADIACGYRTDHSIINITISINNDRKTKTFWKFNSSLLRDIAYVNLVKQTIQDVTKQYAALPYERENIKEIPTESIQLTISDQLFLDVLIMEIRAKTITYGINKKRQLNEREDYLEKEIQRLEREVNTQNKNVELQKKKDELQEIRKIKIDGIIMRSKARWASQGEKINKYFCNMENRHFLSKQMLKLETDQGVTLTTTEDMLEATKLFYEKLYCEQDIKGIDPRLYAKDLPKLDDNERNRLEGKITKEEATDALRAMQNDKSPGTDGMTVNFFKFFWNDIGDFVIRSINEGFKRGEMSVTQKEGIIICLPKADKPREYIENWRPISLLNVSYKIGSSCIANRIKTVLPKLINEDQTGFIPGRYIGDNIRILYDIMSYLDENQLPGLLVSIDFEKAFDTVNWSYMNKVLNAFGFGKDICCWISTFYTNIKSYVIINGKVSKSFEIQRGCRQGDPISPYLFVLCSEILAVRIRAEKSIKGINILDNEFKINQFADDTSFTLQGEKESYEKLFKTLKEFGDISGLKINFGKTVNVWLGQKKNSNIRYLPEKNMKWNPPMFKLLGIWFTNDLTKSTEINIKDKLAEIKCLFKVWSKRICTPLGRIAILKSLILSKLVYLWILLPNPPDQEIKELQNQCYNFVWDKKPDKIKRKYALQNVSNGGIEIPDIKTQIESLKMTWVKKIILGTQKWKHILQANCPEISTIGVYGPQKMLTCKCNSFWKDVFRSYIRFTNCIPIKEAAEIQAEPLFYNEKFKVGNRHFHYTSWSNKNIYFVKDLLDENGQFLSYECFCEKYELKVNYLQYMGCIRSIKSYLKKHNTHFTKQRSLNTPKSLDIITKHKKGARIFYNVLLENVFIYDIKPFAKWEEKLQIPIDWETTTKQVSKIKEIKYKWFQIRLCHNILVNNRILKKMGITNTDACNFCRNEQDSAQHYLWQCTFSQYFWHELEKFLKEKCQHCSTLKFNIELVLFGNDSKTKTDDALDQIILHAKHFIYRCRINKVKPTLKQFIPHFKESINAEKYTYTLEMRYHKFIEKWCLYQLLLEMNIDF